MHLSFLYENNIFNLEVIASLIHFFFFGFPFFKYTLITKHLKKKNHNPKRVFKYDVPQFLYMFSYTNNKSIANIL